MRSDVFDPPRKMRRTFKDICLRQPWGAVYEKVRVHPPVDVPTTHQTGTSLFIFVPRSIDSLPWTQSRIDYRDKYPNTFIAWDEDAQEYAIHHPGSDSVVKPPTAKTAPIIRGETEALVSGAGSPPREPRKRRRFMDWWTSHSRSNDIPDFLRKDK